MNGIKVEIFRYVDDGKPLRVCKPFTTFTEFGPAVYLLDTKGELIGVEVEPNTAILTALLSFGYSSGIVYLK